MSSAEPPHSSPASLGLQLIAELYGCAGASLGDPDAVERAMNAAAREAGLTIVGSLFHRFSPHGVSGAVILAESHFMIHTWPEYGYAAVDLFTCGDHRDAPQAIRRLAHALGARSTTTREIRRGENLADAPSGLAATSPASGGGLDGLRGSI